MINYLKYSILYILIILQSFANADEGLWLPLFLKQNNEVNMQAKGMSISADDIYNINHASIKDAVVLFGGGCTGFIVSNNGLLFTNHHCGYSNIASISTTSNNYIKKGFWAKNYNEEIPCPNLFVSFLISMTDVTDSIAPLLHPDYTEKERNNLINKISNQLVTNATANNGLEASIEPAFNNTRFFLCLTKTYTDIRFVGAPPESIGNFGGDTDNWMWPRHNADFSMFRIYADSLNNPAPYSKSNKPYNPIKVLSISTKSIKENDFAMVIGYPGATREYLTTDALLVPTAYEIPWSIKISEAKLNVLSSTMKQNDKLHLKYAPRFASIANGYKKYKGIEFGMNRYKTIDTKLAHDSITKAWLIRHLNDTTLFYSFKNTCQNLAPITKWSTYFSEAFWRNEAFAHAIKFRSLIVNNYSKETLISEKEKLLKYSNSFFKSIYPDYTKNMFSAMLERFFIDIPMDEHPLELFYGLNKYQNKNDVTSYAHDIINNSFLFNEKKLNKFISTYKTGKNKALFKDPLFKLVNGLTNMYITNYKNQLDRYSTQLDSLNRIYIQVLQTMYPDSTFYPDANGTMRVSYGQIKTYKPKDAVNYGWQTTIDGVIQKTDTSSAEFKTPYLLQKLYYQKEFGTYAIDSTLPVNFITNCQTSGGNSGSPVLNNHGDVIGINFDRNWEGTMSDYDYNPEICRNIATDFHYILFIIEKIGEAQNIINELNLVQ